MVEQRFTFDAVADEYDAYRPGYPDGLFDDLMGLSPSTLPVLEIGSGTGKATEGLLRGGRPLVAVEPGASMIDQARKRIGAEADARFHKATFESWTPDGGPFGLIACAQAWHWVDPSVGFPKAASSLADDGVLAIFGNVQPQLPEELWEAVAAVYAQIHPAEHSRPGGAAYRPGEYLHRQFEAAADFETPTHHAYRRVLTHTPDSYAALTNTYSDVQMLEPEVRARLLAHIREALARRGERFEVEVETHLYWARPRR